MIADVQQVARDESQPLCCEIATLLEYLWSFLVAIINNVIRFQTFRDAFFRVKEIPMHHGISFFSIVSGY